MDKKYEEQKKAYPKISTNKNYLINKSTNSDNKTESKKSSEQGNSNQSQELRRKLSIYSAPNLGFHETKSMKVSDSEHRSSFTNSEKEKNLNNGQSNNMNNDLLSFAQTMTNNQKEFFEGFQKMYKEIRDEDAKIIKTIEEKHEKDTNRLIKAINRATDAILKTQRKENIHEQPNTIYDGYEYEYNNNNYYYY